MPWVDGWIQYLPFLKLTWHPKTLGFGRWIPFWVLLSWQVIVVLSGIDRAGSIPKPGWILYSTDPSQHCRVLQKWNRKTFLAAFPFKCEDTLFLIHFCIYTYIYIYLHIILYYHVLLHSHNTFIYAYYAALPNCFVQFVYEYIHRHTYIYISRFIYIYIFIFGFGHILYIHRNTQITS